MELDLAQLIILTISALITSSISAVLGMGGGIILLGIMAIIIPDGYMVIALHGMIQLFSNTTRTFIFRNHIKTYVIKDFTIGALIGATISGLIIYILIQIYDVDSASQIKVDFLKPIIGVFIIWYLFLKKPKKERKKVSFLRVGGISGISSVFVGATGPLIAPFFLNSDFKKFISSIPPLIKGYIRLGAFVGDGAVIDYDFNTTDVCIVLPTKKVAARYMDHFDRK